jgi:putative transposase
MEEPYMLRRSSITLPGVPHHLIQRGNKRRACLFTDDDNPLYLDWLHEYVRDSGCGLHA